MVLAPELWWKVLFQPASLGQSSSTCRSITGCRLMPFDDSVIQRYHATGFFRLIIGIQHPCSHHQSLGCIAERDIHTTLVGLSSLVDDTSYVHGRQRRGQMYRRHQTSPFPNWEGMMPSSSQHSPPSPAEPWKPTNIFSLPNLFFLLQLSSSFPPVSSHASPFFSPNFIVFFLNPLQHADMT